MFESNKKYVRRQLHKKYGGQMFSGISTPTKFPFIFIFTSENGEKYGYIDKWKTEKLFYYSGQGQKGDMEFISGNKRIRDHKSNNKKIYLFEKTKPGVVKFISEMKYVGHHFTETKDSQNNLRKTIIFELEKVK